MDRYVAFFHEIGLDRLAQAGGKGANLGALTRWGFNVPGGFCVQVSAYDAFFEQGALREPIRRRASRLSLSDLEGLEAGTEAIRKQIESSGIPEEVEASIRKAWDVLSEKEGIEPLVAVRSSVGTRDGSRSSFPGQMDTYHNVRGIDQVLDLIRKCWGSVWTSRAAGTRLKLGLGPDDVVIAPLVQVMVPSEVAGVLFTANPVTGNRDQVMINAAFGLGEAVVSGSLTPDEFILNKETGEEVSRRIGRKSFKMVLHSEKGSGTHRVVLGQEESLRPSLTGDQLAELTHTGRTIEANYGGDPQDIEWAYAGGRLYLLQSRKITALDKVATEKGAGEDDLPDAWACELDTRVTAPPCVYTSANISEVLPGVLTPLTSYGLKALDYGFWKPNYELGLYRVPFPEDKLELIYIGLFYGRPHLNLTRFRHITAQIPGGSASEFDRPLPREETDKDDVPHFQLTPTSVFVFSRFLFNSVRMLRRVPRELELYQEKVQKEYEALRKMDLPRLPFGDLVEMLERDREEALKVMSLHIENSTFAVSFFELLRKLCARWLGDENGVFASRLVTGLTTLESARPNREIFKLYRIVNESVGLRRLFLNSSPEGILQKLKKSRSRDAPGFLRQVEEFLARYGYRSVNEAELMLPSWAQDPSFVFSMITNLLKTKDPKDPATIEKHRVAERTRAVAEARDRLPVPKRRLFEWILEQAQTFIAGRENNKALLMMGVHGVKLVFSEISCRLHQEGILDEREDLYFLTDEEVVSVCKGERFPIRERIASRRREWEWNRRITLPETFRGRPRPMKPEHGTKSGETTSDGTVLQGLGVSPGRVTGKARVILNPREDAHIEQGEILVAPVTDAGWTPLFLIASAIVVDVGGLLSHGSIVAREYGIPGVLNVMSGTKRIKTGQTITVDGNTGNVIIHSDAFA